MALRTKKAHSQPKTATSKRNTQSQDTLQTFTAHIRELRRRLFLVVISSLVVGSLVYYFHDFFVRLVMAPLEGQKLIYLTPAGGFSFVFMVTFYVTMLVILPFTLYQIYAFIRPAIPAHTSRLSFKVGVAALLLMATGATFGYMYAVPGGLHFLNNFASDYVTASLTADSYLKFVLGYVLGIGALFELPLLLLFYHWIHPLTPKGLLNSERYIILGAFIAAAILSPSPDALSQTIIAVPIIIVYQFGALAVLLSIRKTRRQQKRAKVQTEPPTPEETPRTQPLVLEPELVPIPMSSEARSVRPPRSTHSLDGMKKSIKTTSLPSIASSPKPQSPRPAAKLMVPNRARLISDFGPIRSSAVDTTR